MSAQDPLLGVAIGRYVIEKKLAEGGMGAVYTAVHSQLATVKKVVKVLLPAYSSNEAIRQRFTREATAAARLKHRNIIAIDDFGTLPDGQLFLMMPFLDGKPLDTHIQQNGTLSQHHTLHIMVQVCRALQHLHDAGLVHRDLKPGNIFLTETDDNPYEVTLLDLGIARDVAEDELSRKTITGMSLGTPGYMAVEQFGAAGTASPAADIYAAAIITWEMLTGHMPWGVHAPAVLYHLQMTKRPEPPDEAPIESELLALLRRALSVDPGRRHTSAREFAVAFASLTPALPPHVPSGAEILTRFAKEFIHNASPVLQTVRYPVQSESAMPALWPMRSTQVPHLPNEVPIIGLPPAHSIGQVTVNERSQNVIAASARPTTLSASTGVTQSTPPAKRRGAFMLGAVGVCAVAAVATFGMMHSRNSQAVEPAASTNTDATTRELTVRSLDAGTLPADAATHPVDAPAAVTVFDAAQNEHPQADASVRLQKPVPLDSAQHRHGHPRSASPPDAGLIPPSGQSKSTSTPAPDAGVGQRNSGKPKIDPDAVEE